MVILLMDQGKEMENLLKRVTILDAIEKICDSWEELKISTFTGVWKNLSISRGRRRGVQGSHFSGKIPREQEN